MSPPLDTSPYTTALRGILEHQAQKNFILDEDMPTGFGITIVEEINKELDAESTKKGKISASKYKFKKYLALGGEAILIKAYCEKRQRIVVIKVALPAPSEKLGSTSLVRKFVKAVFIKKANEESPEKLESHLASAAAARFNRSAMIQKQLADLINRNDLTSLGFIPAVFEIGVTQKAFFTMEYFEDPPLEEWMKTASVYQRIIFFEQLLVFFEKCIHSNSIVHCDIKPENFLVRDDRPILLDFGVAKNISRPSNLTLPGTKLGSPLFLPPEIRKEMQNRGYLVDIYQLGILLYIVYLGKMPDPTCVVSMDLLTVQYLFPYQRLPPELQPIFIKATQENPDDRYDDISSFRKDFEDFVKIHLKNLRLELQPPNSKHLPSNWHKQIPQKYLKTMFYLLKAMDYTWDEDPKK